MQTYNNQNAPDRNLKKKRNRSSVMNNALIGLHLSELEKRKQNEKSAKVPKKVLTPTSPFKGSFNSNITKVVNCTPS